MVGTSKRLDGSFRVFLKAVILALGISLAAAYLFRDQLFAVSKPRAARISSNNNNKIANGGGNPRDFVAKMREG
jgi:NADPH-ferrihemoprotein reductase